MKRNHLYKVSVTITVVLLLAVISSFIGASSSPVAAQTQTFKWRFAIYDGALTTIAAKSYQDMAKGISDRTNGKFQITVYPSGQLGYSAADHQKVLSQALLEMGETMAGTVQGAPGFLVFSYPGLFKNVDDAQKAWKAVEADLQQAAGAFNAKLLGHTFRGIAGIHSTKRGFPTVDSFKGAKMRAWNSMSSDILAALGAVPQVIPYAERFSALSTGIVEGNTAAFSTQVDSKDYEVCKFTNAWPWDSTLMVTFVNVNSFNALPKEYQTILQEELTKSVQRSEKEYLDVNNNALNTLAAKGVTIVRPEAAEITKYLGIAQKLHDKWQEQGGDQAKAIYKKVRAAIGY
jgi:TRAP-type transport system periplasmic protein